MKYRSDDGTEEEIIWNSRDGVTPFVISLKSGKSATHVDWHSDKFEPDHLPKPGERIFVDLVADKAVEYARKNLERWKVDGIDMFNAPTAEELAREYMKRPGAPDIKEVE